MTSGVFVFSALLEKLELHDTSLPNTVNEDILNALQGALELELATIPLYATACWSIIDETSQAWILLHEIFKDEMWHLANLSNLIAGLGGRPSLVGRAPRFPGALPGGVHPRLRFGIDRFSRAVVRAFLELEHPTTDVVSGLRSPEAQTVGRLYAALITAFQTHEPQLDVFRQLDSRGPEGSAIPAATAADAVNILERIAGEGEGTSASPDDQFEGDRAHFYGFAELYYGRELEWNASTKSGGYTGALVPMPRTYSVAEAPDGGWLEEEVPRDVWTRMSQFDMCWSELLQDLQNTWQGEAPDKAAFRRAVGRMRMLPRIARELMSMGYLPRYQTMEESQ